MNADPDPDPATQINADPCGSGSETLNICVYYDFVTQIQGGKNLWHRGREKRKRSCQYKRFLFCLGYSSRPSQNIFFLTAHYFNAFVPFPQQARQAVVPRPLSINTCLWLYLMARLTHGVAEYLLSPHVGLGFVGPAVVARILLQYQNTGILS